MNMIASFNVILSLTPPPDYNVLHIIDHPHPNQYILTGNHQQNHYQFPVFGNRKCTIYVYMQSKHGHGHFDICFNTSTEYFSYNILSE